MIRTREEAIEQAAKFIYSEKGDRLGIEYVGWDNETEDVRDEWREDVRKTINAYELFRDGRIPAST